MLKKQTAKIVIVHSSGLIHEVLRNEVPLEILAVDYDPDRDGINSKELMQCPFLDSEDTTEAHLTKRPIKQNSAKVAAIFAAFAGSNQNDVQIYCDGAANPNPGPIGSGIAVYRGGGLKELWYGLYDADGTSNVAELNALHHALQMAELEIAAHRSVQVLSDSKYALDSVAVWADSWKKRGWRRSKGAIKNLEIIQAMHAVYCRIKPKVRLTHVRGHAGTEGNELADWMATLAVTKRQPALQRYVGALPPRRNS